MSYILFDTALRTQLLPFTHTRPIADIRCGILTLRERWEQCLAAPTASLCPAYMQAAFPTGALDQEITLINGAAFAHEALFAAIQALNTNEQLVYNDIMIAAKCSDPNLNYEKLHQLSADWKRIPYTGHIQMLEHIWDIFTQNETYIVADFNLLTQGRTSQPLASYVTAIGAENIFVEEGAQISACIINASKGPVYIGADAEIMEGCMLRGPIALGAHACLKMGAKVYGGTTIGPGCKVGGEVSNSVFFANSNKGHDGFIGNAVIGEWCNLGADTNCSNLKNNYDFIKIWDEDQGKLINTGLQFCGLMMGDHSKTGINTMFNTGTVVGVSANIFGSGFPEKFIPSFSWGGADGIDVYDFDKAMQTAARMMARRNQTRNEAQMQLYRFLFDQEHKQ
jgi:UDP-N-acetylglucosamine diphosphorylase/glucosamine-1-phosphate N-acetyltransferase